MSAGALAARRSADAGGRANGSPGRRVARAAALALALLIALLLLAWARACTAAPQPPTIGAAADGPPYPWRGALHVHTELSTDAHGTLADAVRAAAAVGADFLLVTDHTAAAGADGRLRPRWQSGVLVVPAEEISTDGGHLLALGIPAHPYALGPTATQALADIAELGGYAIVAHPLGGEVSWRGPWTGTRGLEVASWSAALGASTGAERARLLARALWDPAAAVARAMHRHGLGLRLWDELTRSTGAAPRTLVGVGALDAHGPLPWLGVPSYRAVMATLTTVVEMDRPARVGEPPRRAARDLIASLRSGRAHVELTALGRAPGFSFAARSAAGGATRAGAVVDAAARWTMCATLGAPGQYRIVLLRDGEAVAESRGGPLEVEAPGPGTYRVEVMREDRAAGTPWIISNPIYVWPRALIEASRLRPAPRLPAPPVDVELLALPGWAAERGDGGVSAIARGEQGLAWEVGLPGERRGGQPYAALAWRPERPVDWSGFRGVAVRLGSDTPWRVALRLYTGDPQREGRVWERVVPADAGERGAGVRWQDFRLLDARGRRAGVAARLAADDLGRVAALVLVVTPERMKPGTATRIEVATVGPFGGRAGEGGRTGGVPPR